MNTKAKIIFSLSLIFMVISVTILAVVAVWAVNRQQLTTTFNISYTVMEVRGTATAQWKLGESGSWNDMTANGKPNGNTVLRFDEQALTDASLSPAQDIIDLSSSDNFIVFKYTFTNELENPYVVDFMYTDDDVTDTNIQVFSTSSESEINSNFVAGVSETYNDWSTATVPGNGTAYIYVLAKVQNTQQNTDYSGSFNFVLDGKNYADYMDFDENSGTILGINNNSSIIRVPEKIDGQAVTAIAPEAFANRTNLTELTIPDSVQTIGQAALTGCSNLKYLQIPFVGGKPTGAVDAESRFGYIFGETKFDNSAQTSQSGFIFYLPKPLRMVTILGGEIPDYAFYTCQNLTNITLKSGVLSIGNNSFRSCTKIKNMSIPETVSSIGPEAFRTCNALETITIPSSVTEIGNNAFNSCKNLASIYYLGTITEWCENNLTYSTAGNRTELLTTSINRNLIINGQPITGSLVIPTGTGTINPYSFCGVLSLTSVTIPASVTEIGLQAFFNCNITSVNYLGTIKQWCEGNLTVSSTGANSYLLNQSPARTLTIQGADISGDFKIPDDVESIKSYAFYYVQSLGQVTIGNGVTEIGSHAFEGSSLTSLKLGTNISAIKNAAFQSCHELSGEVVIPEGTAEVGDIAFKGCARVTSITIPSTVNLIGPNSFRGMPRLTEINYNTESMSSESYSPFLGCGQLSDGIILNFGANITSVPAYLCSRAGSDESPRIIEVKFLGNKVTSIWVSAFEGCNQLAKITIPSSVQTIDNHAFGNCGKLTSVTIESSTVYGKLTGAGYNICGDLLGNILSGAKITVPTSIVNSVTNTYLNSTTFYSSKTTSGTNTIFTKK